MLKLSKNLTRFDTFFKGGKQNNKNRNHIYESEDFWNKE